MQILPPDTTCQIAPLASIAPTSGQLCKLQVMESISGSVVPLAMFSLTGEDNTILTKGPWPYLGPTCTREDGDFLVNTKVNSNHCIHECEKRICIYNNTYILFLLVLFKQCVYWAVLALLYNSPSIVQWLLYSLGCLVNKEQSGK